MRSSPQRARRPFPVALPCAIALAALHGTAAAGGLDLDLIGARAIGRAGTTTVSGDGGAALVTNPAGLARSSALRVQLGLSLHDDDLRFTAADAARSPTVVDRSEPQLAPTVAVVGGLGPVVLGAAYTELGRLDRLLPAPLSGQPVGDLFPHRYGGLALRYRRRAAVVGVAVRAGDWLGLGASVGASRVELDERRRVWAGFSGTTVVGDERHDLDLRLGGRDRLVPLAAAGALVAPPSLPLELAASLSWSADADLAGELALDPTGNPQTRVQPSATGPLEAAVRVGMPTTLRAGARYLGQRLLVEVGGELTWFTRRGAVPTWSTSGMEVTEQVSGATTGLGEVPSLAAQRDHGAVRGAVDVELIPGLLWATAGYAYATGATGRRHLSAGFGDLAGHTASVGLEATWNQITFALGLSRRFSPSVTVPVMQTDGVIANPFGADRGSADAGAGQHGRGHDAAGLTVEVGWD